MRPTARALGWYHVAGAIAGGLLTIYAALAGGALVSGGLAAGAIPFALSLAAGRMLLAGHPKARALAYLTQVIQIPIVLLPAVSWKFVAGVIASVVVTETGTRLYLGLEATWLMGSGGLSGWPATLGLNFAPIVVCVLLKRMTARSAVPESSGSITERAV